MDDADAGRPLSLVARLTWPAALADLLLGGALAAPVVALLPGESSRSRALRVAIAGGAGAICSIPSFLAVITPVAAGTVAFGGAGLAVGHRRRVQVR